jgi:hypothetical protein
MPFYLVYPIVLTEPTHQTVLQNHSVRFDCEVDGRPKPSTSWLFKNQSVSTRHSVMSNGSLLLYSVQNNDLYEGEYSCFAENEAGQSERSGRNLTVHGKFLQGKLECRRVVRDGIPLPVTIKCSHILMLHITQLANVKSLLFSWHIKAMKISLARTWPRKLVPTWFVLNCSIFL